MDDNIRDLTISAFYIHHQPPSALKWIRLQQAFPSEGYKMVIAS